MQVTIYLYTNIIPTNKETLMRCLECNRGLFKYSASAVTIANVVGGKDVFTPTSNYIEHECHSCHSTYKVLFQ